MVLWSFRDLVSSAKEGKSATGLREHSSRLQCRGVQTKLFHFCTWKGEGGKGDSWLLRQMGISGIYQYTRGGLLASRGSEGPLVKRKGRRGKRVTIGSDSLILSFRKRLPRVPPHR